MCLISEEMRRRCGGPARRGARVLRRQHLRLRRGPAAAPEALARLARPPGAARLPAHALLHPRPAAALLGHRLGLPLRGRCVVPGMGRGLARGDVTSQGPPTFRKHRSAGMLALVFVVAVFLQSHLQKVHLSELGEAIYLCQYSKDVHRNKCKKLIINRVTQDRIG